MSPASSRRHAQGVIRYSLPILIALIAVAGGLIFWQIRHGNAADQPANEVAAASGPVAHTTLGTDELLQHARDAMTAQRLLAPAGNNAFEFYLAVLQRQPGNRVAQDALREIFPFAANAAEQVIDAGDDAEAQREIELLARADPHNYTLTLLQSKLQAQRAMAQQQAQQAQQASRHESATAQAKAPAPAATPAPVPAAPAMVTAQAKPANVPAPSTPSALPLHVPSTPVEAAPASAVHARPVAAADATGAAVPVLTHRVEPAYPPEAKRTRRQGWVDVTFTVQPDGSVSGASVADAEPKYVFDRAALAAVSRWQFSPGMQDGKPVAAQVRQRIEFRL
ncbi:protein TonB [Dyella jiangningensis]|uniref:energy transducer TonB n=1 Tax=Dyella sp. AtDHG13 TaxID=1938897 RepID=UPI00088B05F6|nr:energy transducer TonB [Dyella sp. AtDHG13]PXV56994.1 protein TonB [Dyella sp. AtDHG13]SDK63336.1 protein TonB [Dyella jiangningensis]